MKNLKTVDKAIVASVLLGTANDDSFDDFIKDIPKLKVAERWIFADVRPGRGEEKWLDLILRKSDTH